MKAPTVRDANRRPLPLGELVGRGGEGEVYGVAGRDDLVAKIYTGGRAPAREAKIKAMLAASLASDAELVSYPNAVVLDDGGRFAGFLMRKVARAKPLHQLYKPIARKKHFPKADYRFLVHVALNVAKAVASVHRTGCVIGDVNESGVLVTETGKVALIDADSFQVEWNGKRFVCEVGKPEYTAPELQNRPLKELVRTTDHDCFALAVIVFQLLWLGRHPFSGVYRGKGEMPLERAIAERRFAYSRRAGTDMSPPPGALDTGAMPASIIDLFEKAFGPAGSRPSAEAWVAALEGLRQGLRQCLAEPTHHHPGSAPKCPWCAIRRDQGVELFPPAALPVGVAPSVPSWSDGFDIVEVWRAIERVTPPPAPQAPTIATGISEPSERARNATGGNWGHRLWGVLAIAAAIGVLAAVPAIWPVWLGLLGFGVTRALDKPDRSEFRRAFESADREWADAVGTWMAANGTASFDTAKADLAAAKRSYEALAAEEKQRLDEAQKARRDRQLTAWLEQFQISRSRIRGIGSSKIASLASFGIETAAEVDRARVLRVPGFGPTNSQPLFDWRRRLESRFQYDPRPNAADVQREAAIRADIAAKAAKLRLELSAGPGKLAKIAGAIARSAASPTPELVEIRRRRDQAEADLRHLKMPVPAARTISPVRKSTPASPTPTPRRPTTRVGGRPTAATSGTPSCPQCSATMVRRTARRGRNAGNRFWGCSRYPACRGTRSI